MTGVPDILAFTRLTRSIADMKARADTARIEAVTGRVEDVTKQTNGDVGGAHLLKKAVDDVKAYQKLLQLAAGRTALTQTTLGGLAAQSNQIATEALAAFEREDDAFARTSAKSARDAVIGAFASLNASLGGRALFGGDATTNAPLASPEQLLADVEAIMAGAVDAADAEAQLDAYFNDPAGGFETTIYQGGANDAPGVEIAPGIRVNASAKANDQAIKDLIRGLAELATFETATFADAESIGKAGAARALQAQSDVTALRAGIGVSEGRIADTIARYETEEAVLTSLFNKKTARDTFEAASELQLLERQIENSYLLTARLSQLSFINFIR